METHSPSLHGGFHGMAAVKENTKKKLIKKPRKNVTPKVEEVIAKELEPVMDMGDGATKEEELEFLKDSKEEEEEEVATHPEETPEDVESVIEEPKLVVQESEQKKEEFVIKEPSLTKIIETPDIQVAEVAFKKGQKVVPTMIQVDGLPVKIYKIYPKN